VSLTHSDSAPLESTLRRLVEDSVRDVIREEMRTALLDHFKEVEATVHRIVSGEDKYTAGEWLTTKQAAAIVGVQPATIRSWIENQGLPAHRPGGARQYRVRRRTLDEFLSKQKLLGAKPTPEESARKILEDLGEKNLGDSH
jgi:excisionase family DNA binding protein